MLLFIRPRPRILLLLSKDVSLGTMSQKSTRLRTSLSASLRNRVSLDHNQGEVVNFAYHTLLLLLPQFVRAELGLFLCVLDLISLIDN